MIKFSGLLSNKLEEVKVSAYELFNKLVDDGSEVNFLTEYSTEETKCNDEIIEELRGNGELYVLPTIERRCDISGDVDDVHVTLVSAERIQVVKMSDESVMNIKFNNIASLEDQLILLNEMENYLVESK